MVGYDIDISHATNEGADMKTGLCSRDLLDHNEIVLIKGLISFKQKMDTNYPSGNHREHHITCGAKTAWLDLPSIFLMP